MNFEKSAAVSRIAIVVVIVVILIIAGGVSVYFATRPSSTTTTSSSTATASSSSVPQSTTSSSSTSSLTATSSSSSTQTASGNQNITIELQTAPAGFVGIYPRPTNTWPEELLYDPLFNYNETTTSSIPVPWLATGYTADPTGQFWTFTLRQGITFSDGTQFNATSVKDDIDNYILAGGLSLQWLWIRGASAYFASNHNATAQATFIKNDGMTVASQYVLDVNLSAPEADFLNYMTGTLAIYLAVSPSAIARNGGITYNVGNTWLLSHSAGEGPYVLQSLNTATGTMVFTKNTNWWGTQVFGIKQPFNRITINIVSNFATEELDIRSGQASIIPLPPTNIYDFADKTAWQSQHKLVSDVSGTNVYGPYISTQIYMWMMNYQIYTSSGALASQQPLANPYIRAAIDQAWNESAFIQQDLNGFGIADGGVLLLGQLGQQNFTYPYQYNLTQSLLDIQKGCAQLGCSKSNPFPITLIANNDQISELAGSLLTSAINSMQAGITLNFQPLTTPAKVALVVAKQFGINLYGQPNTNPDPLGYLSEFGLYPAGSQASRVDFNNATITSLIQQATRTSDITQREQLYHQIDVALAQSGNWGQVVQYEDVFATSAHIHIASFNPDLLNYLPPIFALSYS